MLGGTAPALTVPVVIGVTLAVRGRVTALVVRGTVPVVIALTVNAIGGTVVECFASVGCVVCVVSGRSVSCQLCSLACSK